MFRFATQELVVTESCEYRGMQDEPRAVHSLAPGTEVSWTWPDDAEQFFADVCARGCSDTRSVILKVGEKTIGQVEWLASARSGHAVASTIQKCRDAGLRVTVDGMPAVYSQPRPSSRKRQSDDDDDDHTTDAKSKRLTSAKFTPVVAPRLAALRPTPVAGKALEAWSCPSGDRGC